MGIISGSGDGSVQPSVNIDRPPPWLCWNKAITVYVNEPGEYTVDNANGFVVVNTDGEVKISGAAAGVVVTAGSETGTVSLSGVTADTVKVDGHCRRGPGERQQGGNRDRQCRFRCDGCRRREG